MTYISFGIWDIRISRNEKKEKERDEKKRWIYFLILHIINNFYQQSIFKTFYIDFFFQFFSSYLFNKSILIVDWHNDIISSLLSEIKCEREKILREKKTKIDRLIKKRGETNIGLESLFDFIWFHLKTIYIIYISQFIYLSTQFFHFCTWFQK